MARLCSHVAIPSLWKLYVFSAFQWLTRFFFRSFFIRKIWQSHVTGNLPRQQLASARKSSFVICHKEHVISTLTRPVRAAQISRALASLFFFRFGVLLSRQPFPSLFLFTLSTRHVKCLGETFYIFPIFQPLTFYLGCAGNRYLQNKYISCNFKRFILSS